MIKRITTPSRLRQVLLDKRALAKKGHLAHNDPRIFHFYRSEDWLRLSYDIKVERGRKCECCGATREEHGALIVTDHIKPLRKYWHLRLDRDNLQILCGDCNFGKGSRDETDFRVKSDA